MGAHVSLLIAEDGADPQRIATLTGHLRRELLQLDVDDVTAPRGDPPPAGARAVDIAALGALVVTLGASATQVKDVVAVLRGWLSHGGRVKRTVRIEIAGDVLELSEATVSDQDRLIGVFVQRHAGTEPSGGRPT
jgi:hypothetical protein